MRTPNDGGTMFPQSNATTFGDDGNPPVHEGASLRAWLAGQALAGLCANPAFSDLSAYQTAKAAVEHADETIAALLK